jgi:hypothetical protein
MKKDHIVVLSVLLGGLVLLALLGFFRKTEGFASTILQCPAGYRFMNGANGDSFCCRGTIDTYTHKCVSHKTPEDNNLCAFARTADPMDSKQLLPLCSSLIETIATTGAANNCPAALPHFVTNGMGVDKCCRTASDNLIDCSAADLKDKEGGYCIAKGAVEKGEKSCDELRMLEGAECPNGAGFAKIMYPLGTREESAYGEKAKGRKVPVCTRVNDTCIPDAAITYLQGKGVFTDKNVNTWKWACGVWDRVVKRGDQTVQMVSTYP